jgi:hypothetical protein
MRRIFARKEAPSGVVRPVRENTEPGELVIRKRLVWIFGLLILGGVVAFLLRPDAGSAMWKEIVPVLSALLTAIVMSGKREQGY